MEDKKNKRKEWIKNLAIIFLVILLILTFFSNTIMNYSLPQVATQYVENGNITTRVRGSGTVETGDLYNVCVKETRKVKSLAVKVGDKVQEGDILLYLDEAESSESEAARKKVKEAEDAFDTALIGFLKENDVSVINSAKSGQSIETYMNKISAARKEKEAADTKVDDLTNKSASIQNKIDNYPASNANVTNETNAYNNAKAAADAAETNLTVCQNALDEINRYIERIGGSDGESGEIGYYTALYDTVSNNDAQNFKSIIETKKQEYNSYLSKQIEAKKKVDDATTQKANADLNLKQAENNLNNKKSQGDTTGKINELKNQKAKYDEELEKAKEEQAKKVKAFENLLAEVNISDSIKRNYEAITEAKEELAKLSTSEFADDTLKAPISGTIANIGAAAGKEISAAAEVMQIQPEGKGYTMKMDVTTEQSKIVSVGDKATPVNTWADDDIDITLKSIKVSEKDPAKMKTLIFEMEGENIVAGHEMSVQVGQRTQSFDLIVPNSAIREDNNGKFVLVITQKSSPLGNRYIATREDVTVLASDDTKSAISGAIDAWQYIITTANKPVEPGDQVRLNEQ
ncbi:MAG: HlyD family efflux transporter periplasmic adaptor subunit [Lachnospiraceae bacterium]|nr:HlyD family efflux transporter periplasmic adaptor subunit [Lachnospiraceae bacterium]